jgi:hypothetical protein
LGVHIGYVLGEILQQPFLLDDDESPLPPRDAFDCFFDIEGTVELWTKQILAAKARLGLFIKEGLCTITSNVLGANLPERSANI